jgi:hypothetical protein
MSEPFCAWAEFDRKCVIRPPVDYSIAYATGLMDPLWTTEW